MGRYNLPTLTLALSTSHFFAMMDDNDDDDDANKQQINK